MKFPAPVMQTASNQTRYITSYERAFNYEEDVRVLICSSRSAAKLLNLQYGRYLMVVIDVVAANTLMQIVRRLCRISQFVNDEYYRRDLRSGAHVPVPAQFQAANRRHVRCSRQCRNSRARQGRDAHTAEYNVGSHYRDHVGQTEAQSPLRRQIDPPSLWFPDESHRRMGYILQQAPDFEDIIRKFMDVYYFESSSRDVNSSPFHHRGIR